MKFPRMNARRRFWTLMGLGLLWSVSGWRWDGQGTGWMASTQNGLSQPVETAAIPPSFVLTTIQGTLHNALRSLAAADGVPETTEALREKYRALQNENTQLKGMLMEANSRLEAMRYLHAAQIEPADVLAATVIGYQAGPGACILKLDKGRIHGVKPDAAVIAPLEQVHLLGRVIYAGELECEVRLASDPRMRIQAQIVRPRAQAPGGPGPVQNLAVTGELCLSRGLGNGQMLIDNIDAIDRNANQPVPQSGDLVCLTDGSWPAKVQHMVFGEVQSVAARQDNALRYDIRLAPRLPIAAQRTVMILIHE
jgi:hypothetical protein